MVDVWGADSTAVVLTSIGSDSLLAPAVAALDIESLEPRIESPTL
jgi:hypothetical protein